MPISDRVSSFASSAAGTADDRFIASPYRRLKALTVIGTRPQFIKYAAVSDGIRTIFEDVLVNTGQHYAHQLSQGFVEELTIPDPAYDLDAATTGPISQLADMLVKLDRVIAEEAPDVMICFGDTNSTLAAALTSVKNGIPIAHIEAGERSFSRDHQRVPPWTTPEETNRVLTDQLASLLLCVTTRAASNLKEEGVSGTIHVTGDVMWSLHHRKFQSALQESTILTDLRLPERGYFYATIHRAINTDDRDRLETIMLALDSLGKPVVLPLHPRTEKRLKEYGLDDVLARSENITILEPVSYADSVALNYHSDRVITDSGGVMREAFFNGVPSVCLDDTTAWIDIVASGWSVLAGAEFEAIIAAVDEGPPASERPPIFGQDGVLRTVAALAEWAGCTLEGVQQQESV